MHSVAPISHRAARLRIGRFGAETEENLISRAVGAASDAGFGWIGSDGTDLVIVLRVDGTDPIAHRTHAKACGLPADRELSGDDMALPKYEPTVPNFITHLGQHFAQNPMMVRGDERITYAEAAEASAGLALGLLDAGVRKGTHVGILLPNGPDWVEAWLAITRIGAIAIPFNTFFQSRELSWMLEHADIELLICATQFLSHDYAERLEQAVPQLATQRAGSLELSSHAALRAIYMVGDCERPWANNFRDLASEGASPDAKQRARLDQAQSQVCTDDEMMILYSSGSTADPKGAVHTHGTVIAHSYNLLATRDLVAEDRVWSPMPFFWVGGLVFSMLGCMHTGACLVCEDAFEPEQTLRLLERERITIAAGWPHFGLALAKHPSLAERDLSRLRDGNLPDLFPESVVPLDPELRPNALGMTETCGPHTCVNAGPLPEALRGSHGVAVEGIEHKIVDPDTGAVLPAGEVGEICVRGYSLMRRLHKVPAENTFDVDGFYHTGDAGSFNADGVLYFEARLGDMIKTGGANVTPSEVEQVMNAIPGVEQSYVVGLPDPERGQLVAAAVVLDEPGSTDADQLRAQLKGELAAYKIPRHIFLKAKSELPFTESGKLDKKRLAEALQRKS